MNDPCARERNKVRELGEKDNLSRTEPIFPVSGVVDKADIQRILRRIDEGEDLEADFVEAVMDLSDCLRRHDLLR